MTSSRPRRPWFLVAMAIAWPTTVSVPLALEAPQAEARSGGSGGGFSRSSGGGSRSSGSSRSSSSSRSSGSSGSRSSGGGYYSGGGGGAIRLSPGCMTGIGLVFLMLVVWALVAAFIKKIKQRKAEALSVGRVQLGFDAVASKGLRARIEDAVRNADTSTSTGIYRLARTVLNTVVTAEDHVAYAHFSEDRGLDPVPGEARFNALAGEARAFFDREIVRRDGRGLVETQRNSAKANELTDEDGQFGIDELFVVTLVMAVQGGAIGLPEKLSGLSDVRISLQAMLAVSSQSLVGFEVIWTPAAESDILTRDELLSDLPYLAPI